MSNTIKIKIQAYLNQLRPVKDVAFFLFLFLIFEFFWKLCIHLETDQEQLIFVGLNLTNLVRPICEFDAKITYTIIHDIFGYKNYYIEGTNLFFENSLRMNIIWSCTSIKQILLFSFIMCFYPGPRKKKFIFIPLSLLFLSIINIVRLVISSLLLKNSFPEWFIPVNEILNGLSWDNSLETYWQFYRDWYHFFHDGFFKWVYYDGIMFLIWLFWQEKFNLPYQKAKAESKTE